VGVVNVVPVVAGETGEGKAWDPMAADGLNGDLSGKVN